MTIDPRVALTFARRERRQTHWLEIEYPAAAEPTALLNDLAGIGWTADGMAVPEYEAVDTSNGQFTRLGYMIKDIHLTGPKGSGLFGDWSESEKKIHMTTVRAVLRKHGFVRVPVWTKTLADML